VIQDFVPNNLHHFERLPRRNRVDKHVSMDPNKVLRVQNAVFVLQRNVSLKQWVPQTQIPDLPSCIHNLGSVVLTFVFDDSTEGVLNCRGVAFDEVALDELDCQRRLAWVRGQQLP
jgi:hypothetical protein